MIQVKLWLAVCPFDNELYIKFDLTEVGSFQNGYRDIILLQIIDKLEKIDLENNKLILKPGETFESVLNALWDFQKSLLKSVRGNEDLDDFLIRQHDYNKFYDPSTGIITITQF